MEQALLEAFVEAYYEKNEEKDRHALFAMALSEALGVFVFDDEAEHIAQKIAEQGIVVVKDHTGIQQIIG